MWWFLEFYKWEDEWENSENLDELKAELRQNYVVDSGYEKDHWALNTPEPIRSGAVDDFIKALKSNFAKGLKREEFLMQLKSKKKSQTESIPVTGRSWNKTKKTFFVRKLGDEPLEIREKRKNWLKIDDTGKRSGHPIETLGYDSRLLKVNKLNEYYLCVPRPLEIKSENQGLVKNGKEEIEEEKLKKIVSLDPGIRTFQTGYDNIGNYFEWGKYDEIRLIKLAHWKDKLQSKIDKIKQAPISYKKLQGKKYRLRRAMARIGEKIRNLVREVHCKLVKYLLDNYDVVLLPDFATSQMIKKWKRKIGKKTVRKMLMWSFYKFKERLKFKVKEYPGKKVLIVDEHYTSITCGNCGFIHWKLGSNKTYDCPNCKSVLDRDVNAARNILLRFLWKNKGLEDSSLGLCGLPPSMDSSIDVEFDAECPCKTLEVSNLM